MDLTKNITILENQTIELVNFTMKRVNPVSKNWVGELNFNVKDERGTLLYTKKIVVDQLGWNDFWANFNTGRFLYQKYLVNEDIPELVESEFLNS